MLVLLPNKQISERWELFQETLRESTVRTPDLRPDWLTEALYAALSGRIKCWVAIDGDNIYATMITKEAVDEITGQRALVIYAIKAWRKPNREVRTGDFGVLRDYARGAGYSRLTAYCVSRAVSNALVRAFPDIQITNYAILEV